jgi:hypothetical protein
MLNEISAIPPSALTPDQHSSRPGAFRSGETLERTWSEDGDFSSSQAPIAPVPEIQDSNRTLLLEATLVPKEDMFLGRLSRRRKDIGAGARGGVVLYSYFW